MYAPHRIDMDWTRWLQALACCWPGDEAHLRRPIEARAGRDLQPVVFLSVRSAFDALLQTRRWAAGDEILFTALTIDDMPRIARAHGLVPVAVDVDPRTLAAEPSVVAARCGPRTRAIVAAQLFGGRTSLAGLAAVAQGRGLLLVEDAAQAFCGPQDQGDARADVTLQSFGTLKTATALGGCLAWVRQRELHTQMASVQAGWPRQTESEYRRKVVRTALLLAVQTRAGYTSLSWLCRLRDTNMGQLVRKLTRGFGHIDDGVFLAALRRRPSAGLLRVLAQRLHQFDDRRLRARAAAGEQLVAALPEALRAGDRQEQRTHWLVPVQADDATALQHALSAAGFDASGASNVVAVGGAHAEALMQRLVFVPAYPELPPRARRALAAALAAHEASTPC